nr:MAG TPA: hypothetical protein [Caudoviricetes sp.]
MHKTQKMNASQRLRRGPIGRPGPAGTAGRATNGNLDSRTHGKRMRAILKTHACVIPYIIRACARIYRLA